MKAVRLTIMTRTQFNGARTNPLSHPLAPGATPTINPPLIPNTLVAPALSDKLMGILNPLKTLTCHDCIQWVAQCQDTIQDNDRQVRQVITNKDDEEEFLFQGIPIAGENEGDSEDSWESEIFGYAATDDWESEEEETSSDTCPFISLNSMATEDIAFKVGPVKDGIVRFAILPPNYYTYPEFLSTPD